MVRSMLTTVDNPYSPFDQFDEWRVYDERLGHHSPDLLGRVAVVSDELNDVAYESAISEAIDEIVRENVSGVYRKVTREYPDS